MPTPTPEQLSRLRGFARADASHAAAEHAASCLQGPDGAMLPDAVRLYLLALAHERANAAAEDLAAIAATFAPRESGPLTFAAARAPSRTLVDDLDLPASGRPTIVCPDLLDEGSS